MDDVKIELFGCNEERYVQEKRVQNFLKRTPLQLLGMHDHALGLCCSQWHREHFTGRGKNAFN